MAVPYQISTSVDVVLIYIPKEYEFYTAFSDGFLRFDLHDHVKAFAAQKQIATQFLREKNNRKRFDLSDHVGPLSCHLC